jgi:hypothetical protein
MLLEVHPDSVAAGFDTIQHPKFVRRWLRITSHPASAKYTMKLQWSYHHISSTETEVSSAIKDEHLLRCFYNGEDGWKQLPSLVNPISNTVSIASVSDRECGTTKCFMLFIPSE